MSLGRRGFIGSLAAALGLGVIGVKATGPAVDAAPVFVVDQFNRAIGTVLVRRALGAGPPEPGSYGGQVMVPLTGRGPVAPVDVEELVRERQDYLAARAEAMITEHGAGGVNLSGPACCHSRRGSCWRCS